MSEVQNAQVMRARFVCSNCSTAFDSPDEINLTEDLCWPCWYADCELSDPDRRP